MFSFIQKSINNIFNRLLVQNNNYKDLEINITNINNKLNKLLILMETYNNTQEKLKIDEILQKQIANDLLCSKIDEVLQKQTANDLLCSKIDEVLQKQTANDLLCSKIYSSGESYSNSIFSYCINEFQKKNNGLYKSFVYNYYKTLHTLTKIKTINNKCVKRIRIGKNNDGGYIMFKPFSQKNIAYSIGINDDVSWDKDMAGYGYEIYQYDHTILELPENNDHFHWFKVGLTGSKETNELKHLSTLISNNCHDNISGMVLKIDIEGCEWDVLNECDEKILNQFDQIVIELHNLNNLNYAQKIIKGLEKLTKNHHVVNVHGNAYSYVSFCGDLMTPDVLEVTLINDNLYGDNEDNIEGYVTTNS